MEEVKEEEEGSVSNSDTDEFEDLKQLNSVFKHF